MIVPKEISDVISSSDWIKSKTVHCQDGFHQKETDSCEILKKRIQVP